MASAEFLLFQWSAIVVLICISGLFAGLTLGIMSLDITGLEIIIHSGSPQESKFAKRIYPIRQRGNLLLCTLLLGNVSVNALLSILMADMTSGFVGFLLSTTIIVICGEIIPQAACSRYGLAVGYYTTWIVYIFIFIFFPFAYPISKALDFMLGNEMGTIYSRQQLKKLLDIHSAHSLESGVSRNDVTMLSGVLDFGQKKVCQVMTPLEKVKMINVDSVLDYQTITIILENGHSRIPVYEKTTTNIIGCLYVKDLALLNPSDKVPLRTILNLYKRQLLKTWHDTTLEQMLTEFKQGRSHMAVVHKVNNEGEGDPFYENVGIVCLEDIIEEILQDEILDENDIYHNARKNPQSASGLFDYKAISQFHAPRSAASKMSHQQIKAIYSFLSGSVNEFSSKFISEDSFVKLLASKGSSVVDYEKPQTSDVYIYQRGVVDDSFTMVIQGKLEIKSGSEGFLSEGGPFSTLGIGALKSDSFVPDFSARVFSSHVQLLKITKRAYENAINNTNEEYNTILENIKSQSPPMTELTHRSNSSIQSHQRSMSSNGASSSSSNIGKSPNLNTTSASILTINNNNNNNDDSSDEDDSNSGDDHKPILSSKSNGNITNAFLHNIRKSDSNV
ncbi:hypothetical protein DLAC_05977 [Tieghemostelium lacteum]|uniref:Ancient conserved domain protein 2 n=1 Tax=Tieghemostelium lacteum TaxID=361077 RepID=A0A151ZHF6_TIELA|nr:hypothetical protein DLAC_05977 [Tieghemostelium lacteum]|eukprot:KYQ93310.1 hypothetical protein DLAC_05977 [Tieghemostelium lacteum]